MNLHRLTSAWIVGAVVAASCLQSHAIANPQEMGRALYMGYRPWAAGAQATANQMPPHFSACARCHGATGEGAREGGQFAPPLTWNALTRPAGSASAYKDSAAVLAALERGIGRDGASLSPAMPRFTFTTEERDALMAYLQILGSAADQPPGVTNSAVRVGVVLPLQGAEASVGEDVQRALVEVINLANARGGVHGRKIELVLRHAPLDAPTARAEAKKLVTQGNVFALAASFATDDALSNQEASLANTLSERHVSHIASLALLQASVQLRDGWTAPLMPSLQDQYQVLNAALRQACPQAEPDWVLQSGKGLASLSPPNSQGARVAACYGQLPFQPTVPSAQNPLPDVTVLPLPSALLAQSINGNKSVWQLMGETAGWVLVEALGQAGPRLHERSLLEALVQLNGKDIAPGLRLGFARDRLHAFMPEAVMHTQRITPAAPLAKIQTP